MDKLERSHSKEIKLSLKIKLTAIHANIHSN